MVRKIRHRLDLGFAIVLNKKKACCLEGLRSPQMVLVSPSPFNSRAAQMTFFVSAC